MKRLSILFLSCVLIVCSFAFCGCRASEKDVIGTYRLIGGWYGSINEDEEGSHRVWLSQKEGDNESFPNVTAIPEGIDGFMKKDAFYIEITDDFVVEHGSIQFSGEKFLVNHNAKNEYKYVIKRQTNNKNAFNIYNKDSYKQNTNGATSYYEAWENSLTYTYNYGDGNLLCLSFVRAD